MTPRKPQSSSPQPPGHPNANGYSRQVPWTQMSIPALKQALQKIQKELCKSKLKRKHPQGSPMKFLTLEPQRRLLLLISWSIFLGGIACLLQPLSSSMVCVANAFEAMYLFGPVGMHASSSPASTPDGGIQFQARIDGSIPFSLPTAHKLPEAIIFEAKRAGRRLGQPSIAVNTQQAMEHTAHITLMPPIKPRVPGTYHTFMIAQDNLSFYVSIGTYDHLYLDYIFGPGNAHVAPGNGAESFLRIQEFGPFDVEYRDHMTTLRDIMISFLIWQLEPTNKGEMVQAAVSGNPSSF